MKTVAVNIIHSYERLNKYIHRYYAPRPRNKHVHSINVCPMSESNPKFLAHQSGVLTDVRPRQSTEKQPYILKINDYANKSANLQPFFFISRQLTIRNIENDPLIVDTTPEQRACRFHHENKDGLYPKYSYSACTVLCRKKGQLDTCGCNDHFMLSTSKY